MQQAGPLTWRSASVMLALAVGLVAILVALVSLLSWRWTLRPALSVLLLATAFGAYFMSTYGVVIDPTMMVNVLHTDAREVRDLLNTRMLWHVLGIAVLPMVVVWRTAWPGVSWRRQLAHNVIGLGIALMVFLMAGWVAFADLSSAMRNHKSMRYLINPLNSFYALSVLAAQAPEKSGPPQPIGLHARVVRGASTKPPLWVLVVGETARSDHFALNGYGRDTTPRLARLPDTEFISLRNVISCGTSTATSLPCMFSHLGRKAFLDSDVSHENLLDVLQRAGLAVLWIDNQSGCKGLCDRVPNVAANATPAGMSHPAGLCEASECFDEALLTGLDERLQALPAERRAQGVVLVLHPMGSHGPAYAKRSPPGRKPFQPECTSNVLQQCDRQALINAYDNSIAYADEVLAGVQHWLTQHAQAFDPGLLYVSDHGESLGENNLYLHGLPFALAPRAQKHVPWVMWLPEATQAALDVRMACLAQRRDEAFTHDHLFHTMLGLLRVQTDEYQPALDVWQPCRGR
jgi:lipid A ethanolaminephosphotransferase